ncbi:MAG: DUF1579 family protein [Phycisphaerae bacterium]|jgi:hypothetical protein
MRSQTTIGLMTIISCSGLAMAQQAEQTNSTQPANGTCNTTTIHGQQPQHATAVQPAQTPTTKVAKAPTSTGTQPTTNANTQVANRKHAQAKTNANDPFPAYTTTNLPSKQHFDLISSFVGEWTTTTTSFNGETNEPTTSQGQARFFPAMNGRFICGDLEGTLFGKPFKGMGLWGFNTNQNRFESTWVDTQNTGISTFNGEKTNDTTFTWTGTVTNPATGNAEQGKGVTTFNGQNTFTYAFFVTINGKETKAYETTYNRVSAGGPFAIRPVDAQTTRNANANANASNTNNAAHTDNNAANNTTRTTGVSEQPSQNEQ